MVPRGGRLQSDLRISPPDASGISHPITVSHVCYCRRKLGRIHLLASSLYASDFVFGLLGNKLNKLA